VKKLKNYLLPVLVLALVATLSLGLTACGKKAIVVTFDQNYDDAPAATTAKAVNGKVSAPTVTRAGFYLAGWTLVSEASTAYIDFATKEFAENTTVYAQWGEVEEGEFVVTFNYNYGTAGTQQVSTTGGKATIANPTRDGYTFDGWFTAATGGTKIDLATKTFTANTTVYAQWTALPPAGDKMTLAEVIAGLGWATGNFNIEVVVVGTVDGDDCGSTETHTYADKILMYWSAYEGEDEWLEYSDFNTDGKEICYSLSYDGDTNEATWFKSINDYDAAEDDYMWEDDIYSADDQIFNIILRYAVEHGLTGKIDLDDEGEGNDASTLWDYAIVLSKTGCVITASYKGKMFDGWEWVLRRRYW